MLERLIYYFTYTFKNKVSTSFKISLFFLQTVVNVVIMILSDNIGIGVSGGMSNESTEVNNFSSIGKSTNLNVTKDNFLIIENIVNIKCLFQWTHLLFIYVIKMKLVLLQVFFHFR